MAQRIVLLTITMTVFMCGIFAHAKSDEASMIPLNREMKVGVASWYSRQDPGINRHTANNEIFDDTDLTCAMWGVPFNQRIKVTNLSNGKSVVVRVNDRGPHKRFVRKGRVVDLTKSAFRQISGVKKGLIPVQIEFL